MEKIKKLTKENFWNEMYEKYPGEMEPFCKWIDEYKKENEWDYLFCNSYLKARQLSQTKFHDLPIAMQIGIFIQFVAETDKRYGIVIEVDKENDFYNIPKKVIEEFLFHEQDDQRQQHQEGKYI